MSETESRKARVRETAATYGAAEVPATDLKNDWHYWLDQVAQGRRTVTVTRYGKPIATLAPIESASSSKVFGALRGRVIGAGNLIAPAENDWDAER